MKRKILFILVVCIVSQWGSTTAKEVSSLQLMYVVKKVFPEANEVALLIPKYSLNENEKEKIARAAANTKLKVFVHGVETYADIGTALKSLANQSLLMVISSDILSENSSKLFILSKCKEKNISIVATSRDYAQSGALLGLVNENDRIQLILNLKHSRDDLKGRFTESFVQEMGIQEIIP